MSGILAQRFSRLRPLLLAVTLVVTGTSLSVAASVAVAPMAAPAAAVGTYDNATIADKALTYWSGSNTERASGAAACNDAQKPGDSGGQCRAFVNCIVWMASNHSQNLGGASYFQPFLAAGGTEITDVNQLSKGDIVQKYVSDSDLHTFVIVSKMTNGQYMVVDSNHWSDETVGYYARSVTLNSTNRAFRMGTVNGTGSGLSNGQFVKNTSSGVIHRMVGDAPVGLWNWAVLGQNSSNTINKTQAEINAMPAYPTDKSLIALYEAGGAIYRFVGGAPVRLFNQGAVPDYNGGNVVWVNFQSLANLEHMRARPLNGSVISIAEAGGSGIYRFVGGAPIRLFNQGAIPDFDGGKVVLVNSQSLAVHDHMNTRPDNGSLISLAEAGGGGIYTFAGGAPLRLFNQGVVPGFDGGKVVWVNSSSVGNLDHMNAVPSNGTWLASAETGVVYRVAGGAALRLYNWGSIPGFNGGAVIWVNQQTLDARDHLLATPSDGTVLQGLPSGNYWRITAGQRTAIAATSGAVQVDDQTVTAFPLA